jgi:hypothetical protein
MGPAPVEHRLMRFTLPVIILGTAAFFLKAWACICLFPVHAWNDIRLRPSFLIADGIPLYPGLKEGLITTWMYGPVHPLLFYPATATHDIGQVFISAALLNVFWLTLPIVIACFVWTATTEDRSTAGMQDRVLCCLATLLLLPAYHLKFLMADNPSLGFGILSIALFSFGQKKNNTLLLWLAAFVAVTSAFAKVHGLAVATGEILWLLFNRGFRETFRFLLMAVAGLIVWTLIGLSLATSPGAFWEHVVLIPSKLPWAPDLRRHAGDLIPELSGAVVLPALIVAFALWKGAARRHLGIPIFVWLAALPISLSATLKLGGSANSLHPVFYLVPFLLLEFFDAARNRPGWRVPVLALLVLVLSLGTLGEFGRKPRSPITQPCIEAKAMARAKDKAIWLPWRPLATYLATGRHYHDEDGLHVRQLTGLYPRRVHAYAALPENWAWTAVEIPGMSWDIARLMQPGPVQEERQGHWMIYSSPNAVSQKPSLTQ